MKILNIFESVRNWRWWGPKLSDDSIPLMWPSTVLCFDVTLHTFILIIYIYIYVIIYFQRVVLFEQILSCQNGILVIISSQKMYSNNIYHIFFEVIWQKYHQLYTFCPNRFCPSIFRHFEIQFYPLKLWYINRWRRENHTKSK